MSSRAATTRKLGPKTDFEIGQSVGDAVGRFVKDDGLCGVAGLGCEIFETGAAGAGFFGQKSDEVKLLGGEARGDECAEGGIGTGDGDDGDSGGDGCVDEPGAGIADAGHACIGDDSDARASFEGIDEF